MRDGVNSSDVSPSVVEVSIPAVLNRPVDSIYFSSRDVALTASPDLEFVTHLIPAMAQGLPLHLTGPPDPDLWSHSDDLMNVLRDWNPGRLQPISVECIGGLEESAAVEPVSKPGKTALFFTGGVDSFYSLVTLKDTIDALIFVVGFDVYPEQTVLLDRTLNMLKQVSEAFDLPLIVIETNLRKYLDPFLPWDMTHGAALAAVAHALRQRFDRFNISSSFSDDQLHPWGSHPQLDKQFSSSSVQLVHGDTSATRLEKARYIAKDEEALRHLRVCWTNPAEAYNCGCCEKCIRTQLAFDVLGVELPPGLFSQPLSLGSLERLIEEDPLSGSDVYFYQEILEGYQSRQVGGSGYAQTVARALEASPSPEDAEMAAGETLWIRKAETVLREGRVTLTAKVDCGDVHTALSVSYPDTRLPDRPGDALLVWFIPLAMDLGCPLHIEDEVSEALLENIQEFQKLCTAVPAYEGLQPVQICPGGRILPGEKNGSSRPWIAAFGGGVDAWSLALHDRESIGSILYVHGIDREIINSEQVESLNGVLRESAQRLGLELIDVECNLRNIMVGELGGRWDYTFIFSTAGMGHLLQHRGSRMVMAGDNAYNEMQMNEVTALIHPVLLPFLGSDTLEYEVMGMGEMRHEKVAWICEHHPWSTPLFRLCYAGAHALDEYEGYQNCGICEKCLRTQIAFRMAGRMDLAAHVFDQPLDLERVKNIRIYRGEFLSELRLLYYISMYRDVLADGNDVELLGALQCILENSWTTWPQWVQPCWEDPYPAWSASSDWSRHLHHHAEEWVETALQGISDEELNAVVLANDSPLAFTLNDHHLDATIRKRIRSYIPYWGRGDVS